MAKEEFKLKQTKSKFRLNGIVTGLGNKNAYGEGTGKSGRDWKKIRFGVQTSPINTVYVELMGSERDNVVYYSKKEDNSIKVLWDDRDDAPDDGYHLMGVNVKLEHGLDGKLVQATFVEFDAVEYIFNNLSDGQHVYINGKIEFNEYENPHTNQITHQTKYVIQSIGLLDKEIDFEAEKFEEESKFEHEIVVQDASIYVRETQKLFISAYSIGYKDSFKTGQFVISTETHKELAENIKKKLKFGDWIKVYGKIINSVEIVQATETDDWGSDENSFATVKNRTNELRIVGVDTTTWEKKKYKEEDFVVDEAVAEFGGGDENPFANEKEVDISDDDLPF